jgi:hypothetical protein
MIAGGQDGWAEHYNSQLLQTQAQEQAVARTEKAASGPQSPRVRPKTQPMSIAAPFNSPANITALSLNIEDMMAHSPPLTTEAWEALADLRDKLAEREKIGWWVIYNGDPDRDYPSSEDDDETEDAEGAKTPTDAGTASGENAGGSSASGSATGDKRSQPSSISTTSGQSGTLTGSNIKNHSQNQNYPQEQRMRSPTGGRIPPPIPPGHNTAAQKASTSIPFRPTPPSLPKTGKGTKADTGKELPKSPGLRKFFGIGKKS